MPALDLLSWLGWLGAAEAMQGLMVIAIVSGPIVGVFILLVVKRALIGARSERLAIWLACIAIPGPLLTVLLIFWLAKVFYRD